MAGQQNILTRVRINFEFIFMHWQRTAPSLLKVPSSSFSPNTQGACGSCRSEKLPALLPPLLHIRQESLSSGKGYRSNLTFHEHSSGQAFTLYFLGEDW